MLVKVGSDREAPRRLRESRDDMIGAVTVCAFQPVCFVLLMQGRIGQESVNGQKRRGADLSPQ